MTKLILTTFLGKSTQ